jgi:hypothetical protein
VVDIYRQVQRMGQHYIQDQRVEHIILTNQEIELIQRKNRHCKIIILRINKTVRKNFNICMNIITIRFKEESF